MSDISEWASPERCRPDNSPLPFIANEIYLEILDYFVPSPRGLSESECHSILTTLALVCRFFRAICVPRIFRSITLTAKLHANAKTQRARSDWCRKVINNHTTALSIAACVKICRFSDWRAPVSPNASVHLYSAHLAQREEAVSRFQNLESLYLINTLITQPFFLSVIAKDSLKLVSIINCEFLPLEREWDLNRFQPQWSSVHIARCWSNISPYVLPLSILASCRNLHTCIIHDDHLADAIFSRPVQFDQLRDLRISTPSTLDSFLDRTPSIVLLHWLPRNSSSERALAPQTLPFIQEVSCYIGNDKLLQDLIARHSLQSIGLYWRAGGPDNPVIWEWLQRASSNLKVLAIPLDIYIYGPLCTKFPALEKLELRFRFGMNMSDIEDLCNQWSDHPQVRHSVFAFPPHDCGFNLPDQHHTLVKHVAKAFPQAETIQFGTYFEWFMKDSLWKVEVIDRRELKQCMGYLASSRRSIDLEDFEGTLINIYNDKELENPAVRSLLKLDELITTGSPYN